LLEQLLRKCSVFEVPCRSEELCCDYQSFFIPIHLQLFLMAAAYSFYMPSNLYLTRDIDSLQRRHVMNRFFFLLIAGALIAGVNSVRAATIFESGTLGPTGLLFDDLLSGSIPSSSVVEETFVGVRFHLEKPALVSEVGGHFVSLRSETFFGVIVELTDENDFPDSDTLSTPDVLGTAELTFPVSSGETFGDLNVSLDAGWYALVFGSGLFDAIGRGGAPANNPDIGSPEYIGFQPGFGWVSIGNVFFDFRFVVNGQLVPEPSAIALATLALNLSLTSRRRARLS